MKRDKLEFRKSQLEQEELPNEEELYTVNEEINQLNLELGAI